jgi:predicted TIM-barrel fold metal-dependent hydrolase
VHPECLPYEAHLKSRDLMLKKHPRLRYVGLHLASQEWDSDEVAQFLDNFPNTMVDLAERICHLQHQAVNNWQKVHDFLVAYQDRIIYGTDCVDDGSLTDQELVRLQDERYRMHWKFFTEDEFMMAPKVNGRFRGMELPTAVLKKIYSTNAIKTYGI